jgi:hypothetical protein
MSDILDLCLGSAAEGFTRVDLATLADEHKPMTTVTLSDGVAREAMNVPYAWSLFWVPEHQFKAGEKYEFYLVTRKGCVAQLYSTPFAIFTTIPSEYLPDELEVGKWVYTPTEDFVSGFYFTNDGDPNTHSACDYFALAYKYSPGLNRKMTAIADAIRAKTGGTEKLTLDQMATSVDEVYNISQQAAYDEFWDKAQDYGNLRYYYGGFGGRVWTDETFKPKYDIKTNHSLPAPQNNCGLMFFGSGIKDLKGALERAGVIIDWKTFIGFSQVFTEALVENIGEIDTTGTNSLNHTFSKARNLRNVDKLIFKADGSQTIGSNMFETTPKLETITIGGCIGSNFDIHWSPLLTHDSIISIINALSSDKSGLTVTFSSEAVNNAFETSEGAADGSTSAEWLALVGTKSNWTISLI